MKQTRFRNKLNAVHSVSTHSDSNQSERAILNVVVLCCLLHFLRGNITGEDAVHRKSRQSHCRSKINIFSCQSNLSMIRENPSSRCSRRDFMTNSCHCAETQIVSQVSAIYQFTNYYFFNLPLSFRIYHSRNNI